MLPWTPWSLINGSIKPQRRAQFGVKFKFRCLGHISPCPFLRHRVLDDESAIRAQRKCRTLLLPLRQQHLCLAQLVHDPLRRIPLPCHPSSSLIHPQGYQPRTGSVLGGGSTGRVLLVVIIGRVVSKQSVQVRWACAGAMPPDRSTLLRWESVQLRGSPSQRGAATLPGRPAVSLWLPTTLSSDRAASVSSRSARLSATHRSSNVRPVSKSPSTTALAPP